MAYRHLLLLGEAGGGGTKLDHLDLGPAKVDSRLGERVLDYLRSADRLVDATLAPAALLAARFGLLPEGTDAVELDALLSFFYRLPTLPKLASPEVLRRALADGARKRVFGLASGSNWDADDAVLRFGVEVDPSEIQFQPGMWLVRAAAMIDLVAKHAPSPGDGQGGVGASKGAGAEEDPGGSRGGQEPTPGGEGTISVGGGSGATIAGVTIHVPAVIGSKVREVVKVAVLPLNASSPDVSVELTIRADGGLAGIPKETLNLVVLEGLRQLGLDDVDVEIRGQEGS